MAVAVVALLCLLGGCGDPSSTSPPPTPAAPAAPAAPGAPYRVVALDPARTGRIEGRCSLERAFEPVEIRPGMGVDGPVPSESALTGADLGLSNCIVFLASIAEGKDWPLDLRAEDRTAWIRILPGRYEPRAQWTRVGTQLGFESRIPMDINAHGFQGPSRGHTIFNFSVAPGTRVADVADCFLRRPGVVFVSDDSRGHFQAWVHVSPHPYVEVTRAETSTARPAGGFRLDDVPAGTYQLVCWHEGLEPVLPWPPHHPLRLPGAEIRHSGAVRVTAGGTIRVDFVLPVPASPPR